MAQQTDAHECQRPSEILSLLNSTTEGETRLVNDDDTPWELATKKNPEGVTMRAVFHRAGSDPHAADYDWRDDPRLVVEYVRERHAPARYPDYTIRQVGEGVLDEGEVTRLRDPASNAVTWTVQADPDADDLARLPVEHEDGNTEILAVGDDLFHRVATESSEVEYRRVVITDVRYARDRWEVEVSWGRDSYRPAAVDVAAALDAAGVGLGREAPAGMPEGASVWFPKLEGGDTSSK